MGKGFNVPVSRAAHLETMWQTALYDQEGLSQRETEMSAILEDSMRSYANSGAIHKEAASSEERTIRYGLSHDTYFL